jgi:itaconyl-CoA hydratase
MVAFSNYIKTADHRYRENFGLSFDEFAVGQTFRHWPGVTFSQQDNKDEALETLNNAQLHYDSCYAAQTEWHKCLGVSTLTVQHVVGMTWKTFGKRQRIVGFDDIAMTHPVFGGDTLYAESAILAVKEYPQNPAVGVVTVVTSGVNQHGDLVAKLTYHQLIYKAGQHPLDATVAGAEKVPGVPFASHRPLPDGTYIENVGLYYEDLQPGDIFEHHPGKTVTPEENKMHALRSLEWSAQYSDHHYIERFLEGAMPVNEAFLIGAVTALTTRSFARVVANLQWKAIQLPNPLYAGDTIYAESEILAKRESKSRPTQGILQVNSRAYNQDKTLVCAFERHLLVYKHGFGPYEAAGY